MIQKEYSKESIVDKQEKLQRGWEAGRPLKNCFHVDFEVPWKPIPFIPFLLSRNNSNSIPFYSFDRNSIYRQNEVTRTKMSIEWKPPRTLHKSCGLVVHVDIDDTDYKRWRREEYWGYTGGCRTRRRETDEAGTKQATA